MDDGLGDEEIPLHPYIKEVILLFILCVQSLCHFVYLCIHGIVCDICVILMQYQSGAS